jgi:hypothetical protein
MATEHKKPPILATMKLATIIIHIIAHTLYITVDMAVVFLLLLLLG